MVAAALAFAARLAGRLLSQTRSAAPAVFRFSFRAGRFCAISSCVRPDSTLYACASTSQPGTANSSRFLMISHSLPLPRPFILHQREIALQLLAVQPELEVAARDLRVARRLRRADRMSRDPTASRCPRHSFPSGMLPSKPPYSSGMILHVGREMFHAGIERRPFGNGPRFQHAVDFQPEIVVQPRRIVTLHTEIIGSVLALLL